MKRVLVCGSIAFDHIMDFPGLFKDHILPDKIHALNISFLVNSLKKMRGGTAANIAYNLALIGESPVILGTAGQDFSEYRDWLNQAGVDTKLIKVLADDYTASCFITTDLANNQITGFYPGAMAHDPELSLKTIDLTDIALVVIAPTEPAAMIKWALECKELGIPYLFDPGMQIPRLSGADLRQGILGARIVVFNEYEYTLMLEKTGLTREEILNSVDLLVETLGGKGSFLGAKHKRVHVQAAKPTVVVDPTGAGDAYRAGLIKGYFEGASLEKTGQYASITAVYAVEHKGGTSHKYTIAEFNQRYQENYGGMIS
ncbi:MAG: carbohydrate kinase family protein [Firmicutes bacterium]|nr:carbohydrate kinase family protein [Bacillota bacterium]